MPILTTKILGINDANPKPSRGLNLHGHPMKDGENYWGEQTSPDAPATRSDAPTARFDAVPVSPQPRRRKRRYAWTAERRRAMSAKVKAYWQTKHSDSALDMQSNVLPSVDQSG